jgi:raffinose/stachyose/melibiose transport system permease protein
MISYQITKLEANIVNHTLRKNFYKFNFIFPALFFILLVFLVPNILNFVYSFTNWSFYSSEINFIGLNNFIDLSKSGQLWNDLFVTLGFAFMYAVLVNIISLSLAIALEKTNRINGVFRIIFFIPILISNLATGYIFKGIFSYDGIINQFLSFIGLSNFKLELLASAKYTLLVVVLIQVWKSFGIPMLVFVAGLSTIPEELKEAAKIEGAGFWQTLKNIKMPLLGPAFTFNIALSIIGGLSVFDMIFVLTKGGPGRVTEVLNILMLSHFAGGRMGMATAISLVLTIVIAIIGIPLIIFLRKREIDL